MSLDFLSVLAIVIAIIIFRVVAVTSIWRNPLRKPEPGFEYIYVNYDGSARELTAPEREYLSTPFAPDDGNRPYIKRAYKVTDPNYEYTNGFL